MQVTNKIVTFTTRNPDKYAIIPKSKVLRQLENGLYEMAVYHGLDEARVMKNLGLKKVPSPISRDYDWPGKYKPMSHQVETASFLTLHRRAFVFNDPGTGKTLSALWAADYLMKRGEVQRVLILCPLSIMESAWLADLSNSIIHRTAIACHHSKSEKRIEMVKNGYEFIIANYDGLPLIADTILKDGTFDLIIVDECFAAGTPVMTPMGRQPIEQLAAGDKVFTSDGVMRIKRLVRNTAKQMVEVKLENGEHIRCTPEHPFFTDLGWVCAKNLAGRRLISGAEMSCVRAGVSPSPIADCLGFGEQPSNWVDLLKVLRTEEVALTESGQELLYKLAARATGKSAGAENSGTSSEVVRDSESQWAQTASTGWERHGHDESGALDFRGLTCGVGMELPGSVGEEAARLSYELQTRLRAAVSQGGVRSGREQPHGNHAPSTGSEERSKACGAWVESVTHIERPDGEPVYNLEVEGTPNYFVGDNHWLVHNCNAYKNVSTKRWKTLAKLVRPDTYLWMMTGTPASQSPEDAFGLAKLVNPKGVPNFMTAWRDKVMRRVTQFKWMPKEEAPKLVYDALQPAIRYKKADCLDLPPVITETRDVPLTPQQKKFYNMLKERMLVSAAGETITAVNAAAGVNKLLQISAGAAYTDDHEVVEFDCSNRLAVLMEVLEETDRKVLVFAPFRHSIDTIYNHLTKHKVSTAVIHGDVSVTKRTAIFKAFQETPEPRVLVIQPQSASHGVTLTAADTVVFWGPVMSVETYIQCCARSDRKGQDSDKVTVIHLQGSEIEKRMFKQLENRVDDHSLLIKLYEEEMKSK